MVYALPHTTASSAIVMQLVRSGISDGTNYRLACGALSKHDFVAKIVIVIEEADESAHWIGIIRDGSLLHADNLLEVYQKAEQLTDILATSARTAETSRAVSTPKQSTINNQQSAIP